MNGVANINGVITPLLEAQIPVLDRGLLYGDGIFEGIHFKNKKVLFHEEHKQRFYRSAQAIRLPRIESERYELEIERTVKASGWDNGYLRVVATRGIGAMGINPAKHNTACFYVIATQIQLYPEEKYNTGVKVIIAKTHKIASSSFDCSVKSLCYLPNIVAMWEAVDAGAEEAIMTTEAGIVSEATVDNIFGVKNGVLFTPALDTNCLPGITREKILELARKMKITCDEGHFRASDFINADEVFLTGTGAGIVPVREIGDEVIGSGQMGAITNKLRQTYEELVKTTCPTL